MIILFDGWGAVTKIKRETAVSLRRINYFWVMWTFCMTYFF